jgi:hypothetical protein
MVTSCDVGESFGQAYRCGYRRMRQISDDIRDAKGAGSSDHTDAALLASNSPAPEVALPTTVAVSAALQAAKPESPDVLLQAGGLRPWICRRSGRQCAMGG